MKSEEHTPNGTSAGALRSVHTKSAIIMLFNLQVKSALPPRERQMANVASFLKWALGAILVILHPTSLPSSLKNRINTCMEKCD